MQYIELSIEELKDQSKELAKLISVDFQPDVVVFIAKGSFLIGYEMSNFFNTPLVECFAVRKGNKFKQYVSPILKCFPKKLKKYLRERELQSGLHSFSSDRHVYISNQKNAIENATNILVVDDSVDTGYTVKEVIHYLTNNFSKGNIKVAALNYFDQSVAIFQIDYFLYTNCMLQGPWSKDSKYYKEFISRYKLAKNKGVF